jgi:DNA invertase Pin-like site-specific DNA recombinase
MGELIEQATKGYTKDRYAMYLRKSRADLELEAMGEGETLARHKAMLDNLAAKHGISSNQITVYKEVVSGDSLDDRPEAQRLLNDVHSKHYKGVLVVEVERLARGNTRDQGEVAEAFQASDTQIITPSKIYDPTSEADQTYFEFGLFMSRMEYKTINRRLKSGKNISASEGNYLLPQRVFGYNIERRSKKDRLLVINPEEAKIVQMIFDMYTEDYILPGKIARTLTGMGVQTIKNKPEWSKGTVRDMLSNNVYTGKITWNEYTTTKVFDERTGKLVKKRVKNPFPDVYEGKHEGIISEEQFNKAQQITEAKIAPPTKTDYSLVDPFAGIIKCAKCGRAMRQLRLKGKAPTVTHPASAVCKVKAGNRAQVEAAIMQGLYSIIEDCEIKIKNDHNGSERQRHLTVIAAMKDELAGLERKKKPSPCIMGSRRRNVHT